MEVDSVDRKRESQLSYFASIVFHIIANIRHKLEKPGISLLAHSDGLNPLSSIASDGSAD